MSRRFEKPPLTYEQQIALLQERGMHIRCAAEAEHWLRHISYYRLSAYWHRNKMPDHNFSLNTDFDAIVEIYEFDRRLRLLVLDAIERVEVAFRGSWAYALAHAGGPHAYLNAALYSDRRQFHENFSKLAREVGTSPETFIDHYRANYDEPAMPAVWMVAETMTFGQISRWFSSLKERALRNHIAQPFGLPEAVMVPLVKHLSVVRNTCAHHGRLWNRGFLLRARMPERPENLAMSLVPVVQGQPAKLYNSLVLLIHLLLHASPQNDWVTKLLELLASRPRPDLAEMAFPDDWQSRPMWQP